MPPTDTIFALSTPPGRSGVAIVRLSGPGVRDCLTALAGSVPEPRFAALRTIRGVSEDVIDRGLVLFFPGPASETGEDMAEFHLHGSRAVVAALIEELAARPGMRAAEAGEFARRAFDNGKMDLTAVEGLADLVEAETAAQRRQALSQLGGALQRLYEGWRGAVLSLMARLEASIDFAEEEADVPPDVAAAVHADVAGLAGRIERHLLDGRRGERIREGAALVIAGPPNAGKSTLLNALARRDVAIVSEIAGTTRDAIEVRLDLGGVAVTAVDTAGLREAGDDAVEAEGVRRARARIADADLVLWVSDARCPHPPDGDSQGEVWLVFNKADLGDAVQGRSEGFHISALRGAGIPELIAAMDGHFRDRFEPGTDPLITRERHRIELVRALEALQRALQLNAGFEAELLAEELRIAATALGRIVGRIDVEEILEVIFRDFCIGK